MRIIATGDLHLTLTGRDPLDGRRAAAGPGLARLAPLIAEARAGCPNSMLVDVGDFLQGRLGELLGSQIGTPHPMVQAMNLLRYDAATLGNHDFDNGFQFALQQIEQMTFPIVCANLFETTQPIPPAVLLRRQMRDTAGGLRQVQVGIVGAAPPPSARWARISPTDALTEGRDIPESIARHTAALRAAGADLVIALVHSGLGPAKPERGAEHAAMAVAALPGVDAVIAGHSHEVFADCPQNWPAPDGPSGPQHITASVPDRPHAPLVQAGAFGSHLGMIDLDLSEGAGGALIARPRRAAVLAAASVSPKRADHRITALARPYLDRARIIAKTRIGQSETRLHSHFAAVAPDPAARLLAEAYRGAARRALAQGPYAELPVLGVAPPFGARRDGPALDLLPGLIRRGDLQHICPFADVLVALVRDGAGIRAWLETAAQIYHQVRAGVADQPLVKPDALLYTFDLIEGIGYTIDPAAPEGCRIANLTYNGHPVAPTDRFILATNSYRAGGGGGFAPGLPADPGIAAQIPVRTALEQHLSEHDPWRLEGPGPWTLAPVPDASALIEAAPEAAAIVRAGGGPAGLEVAGEAAKGRVILRMRLCLQVGLAAGLPTP